MEKLQIEYIPISEIKPYPNNPRKNDKAVEVVKKSISEFGFKNPIILDKNNEIIAGHTRLSASKELGFNEVPVIWADGLTEEQVKAFRIMDNKSQEYASWDFDKLQEEFNTLQDLGVDLELTGLNAKERFDLKLSRQEKAELLLSDIILVPAFSVFDGKSGFWISRNKRWREIIPIEECMGTRDGKLAGENTFFGAERSVSVFNHTLAEILVRGFTKKEDHITIPFCEASIFAVSSILQRKVLGIELRKDQVDLNNELIKPFKTNECKVIEGDALDETKYKDQTDFIMSCPPYIGLEKYSNQKEDLSTQSNEEFFKSMEKWLKICYDKLKENCFMAIVFGNIREPSGRVVNICGEVTRIAEEVGFNLYNDVIFLQPRLSTSLRQVQFRKSRKFVRCHEKVMIFKKEGKQILKKPVTKEHECDNQEIMVFYKGDPKQAKIKAEELNKNFKDIDYLMELDSFGGEDESENLEQ
jgi:hypothetical protein